MIKNLSEKQLIEVIKNGNDNLTNTLVVDKQGNVSLFSYEEHINDTNDYYYDYVVINAESFQPNLGYIGISASEDKMFIRKEYGQLNKAWHRYLATGKHQRASHVR